MLNVGAKAPIPQRAFVRHLVTLVCIDDPLNEKIPEIYEKFKGCGKTREPARL